MVRSILFTLITVLLYSCAQKGVLSGGPKDVTSPKVLSSTPEFASKNYRGNSISLTFDEYIQIKNFSKNLIVSPPLKHGLEYNVRGKKLSLSWVDTLQEKTTYTIYLGEAVVDLNEGNPLKENLLVFSTGENIDSLGLKGSITISEDLQPVKEMLVFLYKENEDSIVSKELPNYFAKSNKSGRFEFKYLAAGSYKLFALLDQNNNYLYDKDNESIAFLNEPIIISPDTIQSVQLRSFIKEENSTKLLSKKMLAKELIQLSFNHKIDSLSSSFLEVDSKKEWYISKWNKGRDTLNLWLNTLPNPDSLKLKITANDLSDTLLFYPQRSKGLNEGSLPLKVKSSSSLGPKDSLYLRFNRPIIGIDTSKLKVIVDSIQIPFQVKEVDNQKYLIDFNRKDHLKGVIEIHPSMYSDFIGTVNEDSIRLPFSMNPASSYGNLFLKVNTNSKQSFVLEFYNSSKQLVTSRSVRDSNYSFDMHYLKPGKYTVKLIEDRNENGKWDSGDYYQKSQPEVIHHFKEEINIRANWDLELEFNLD